MLTQDMDNSTRSGQFVVDSIGMCLVQDTYGWSDLVVLFHGEIIHCRITEIMNDPFSELMGLCDGLLERKPASALLLDEPGGHRLHIENDEEDKNIVVFQIFEITTWDLWNKEPILNVRAVRKHLLILIMVELWKLKRFRSDKIFKRERRMVLDKVRLVNLNKRWHSHPSMGPSFLS